MSEAVAEQQDWPGDPAAVLTALRDSHREANAQEARKLALAVQWAALHPAESIEQAATWDGLVGGAERARCLAGESTPLVAEFCLADLAVALAMTPDTARSYLAAALELAHRLPRLYALVMDGLVPAWRARRIAESTIHLPVAGAAFVDRHLAPVAGHVGPAAIDRAVADALARFDPDAAETAANTAADGRRVDVDLQPNLLGTVEVHGTIDLADGLDLATALKNGAQALADLGSELSLDQRRATALGEMARTQLTLDLTTQPTEQPDTDESETTARPGRKARTRKVVIHVHLSRTALDGSNEPVTVRHRGTGETLTLAEQARTWCNDAATVTVVPVIDLAPHADLVEAGYTPSAHLARTVRLRDRHCVFPHCTRNAEACDLDHITPYDHGGMTAAWNLAALCRFHHRLKTHGHWTYEALSPGRYRWRDPRGQTYTVDTRPGSVTRGGTTHDPPRVPG